LLAILLTAFFAVFVIYLTNDDSQFNTNSKLSTSAQVSISSIEDGICDDCGKSFENYECECKCEDCGEYKYVNCECKCEICGEHKYLECEGHYERCENASCVNYKKDISKCKNAECSGLLKSGSGTSSDPYIISYFCDLLALNYKMFENQGEINDMCCELDRDIDCMGEAFSVGAHYLNSAKDFYGNFNGNGYTISNLKIPFTQPESAVNYGNCGFFCSAVDAEIYDLQIKDAEISLPEHTYVYAGFLCGSADGCTIRQCSIINCRYNEVTPITAAVAGLVGRGYRSKELKITNCYVNVYDYTGDANPPNTYRAHIGPVTGGDFGAHATLFSASITNCISNSTFKGANVGICGSKLEGETNNCLINPQEPTGFNYSSAGGTAYDSIWYYAGNEVYEGEVYNNGFPMLRQFMKDWTEVQFEVHEGGTISSDGIYDGLDDNGDEYEYILVPSDSSYLIKGKTQTESNESVMAILNQIITAEPDEGYICGTPCWQKRSADLYAVYFELTTVNLSFGGTIGELSLSPSNLGTFELFWGSKISVIKTKYYGPVTLTYNFKDCQDNEHNVSYEIPGGFKPTSFIDDLEIKEDYLIVQPKIEKHKYTFTCVNVDNASRFGGATWNLEYLDDITILQTDGKLTFKWGQTSKEMGYTPNGNFVFDYFEISYRPADGFETVYTIEEMTEILTNIESNIYIRPIFIKYITIELIDISENAELFYPNNLTDAVDKVTIEKVKSNKDLTFSYSGIPNRILTCKYDNSTIAIFKVNKFYKPKSTESIELGDDKDVHIISVEFEFFAYMVKMQEDDTLGVVDKNVENDNWTSNGSTSDDGIFAVEYGTSVTFEIGTKTIDGVVVLVYTYKFSSDEIVTYTMKDNRSAMHYDFLKGVRISIKNGLNGEETDSYTFTDEISLDAIVPVFGLKQYNGCLG